MKDKTIKKTYMHMNTYSTQNTHHPHINTDTHTYTYTHTYLNIPTVRLTHTDIHIQVGSGRARLGPGRVRSGRAGLDLFFRRT